MINQELAGKVFESTWKLELYLRLINNLIKQGTLQKMIDDFGESETINFCLEKVESESKIPRVLGGANQ